MDFNSKSKGEATNFIHNSSNLVDKKALERSFPTNLAAVGVFSPAD